MLKSQFLGSFNQVNQLINKKSISSLRSMEIYALQGV